MIIDADGPEGRRLRPPYAGMVRHLLGNELCCVGPTSNRRSSCVSSQLDDVRHGRGTEEDCLCEPVSPHILEPMGCCERGGHAPELALSLRGWCHDEQVYTSVRSSPQVYTDWRRDDVQPCGACGRPFYARCCR